MKDQQIKNYKKQNAAFENSHKRSGEKIPSSEDKHNLNDAGTPAKGNSMDAERKATDKAHHSSRSE